MSQQLSHQDLIAISKNTRIASQVSMANIKGMAHYCAVAIEMFETLRNVCLEAKAAGHAITPESLVAWLDEHQAQLNITTAKRIET